jgi:hypothetical protein
VLLCSKKRTASAGVAQNMPVNAMKTQRNKSSLLNLDQNIIDQQHQQVTITLSQLASHTHQLVLPRQPDRLVGVIMVFLVAQTANGKLQCQTHHNQFAMEVLQVWMSFQVITLAHHTHTLLKNAWTDVIKSQHVL